MSHSKRNTSLAFFTSYERSLLKATWGSQSARLSRTSFLPFSSCSLCLAPARPPIVACGIGGELFCRECVLTNILAQRREIERIEKEGLARQRDEMEQDSKKAEQSRRQDLAEFEAAQVGASQGKSVESTLNNKRKRTIDAEEILRNAEEERVRSQKLREAKERDERNAGSGSFWIAAHTPFVDAETAAAEAARKEKRLQPLCPGSDIDKPHVLSMKTLVTVEFKESKDSTTEAVKACPGCDKPLNNASKAMSIPCGHVFCKSCVDKFMQPAEKDPHAESGVDHDHGTVKCLICSTRLDDNFSTLDQKELKKKKKKDGKLSLKPGLIRIAGGGTGFAGAGSSVVEKTGVAFQC